MNRINTNHTKYGFTLRDCIFIGLGLTTILIPTIIAVLSYSIAPLLTGKQWIIASPILLLLTIGAGITLFWLGSHQAVDHKLGNYLVYRAFKWLISSLIGLFIMALSIIFYAWIREPPVRNSNANDASERSADDIWDSHPKHYYDNEPPKPFS